MIFEELLVDILMELTLPRKLLKNVLELYIVVSGMSFKFMEITVLALVLNFKHFFIEGFLDIPPFLCYCHELSKGLVPLGVDGIVRDVRSRSLIW